MSKPVEVAPVVDVFRPTECVTDGCSRPPFARNRCRTCCVRLYQEERRAAVVDELAALRAWAGT